MPDPRSRGPVRVAFFPMHPADDRATDTFCTLPATRSAELGVEGRVFYPSSPGLRHRFYRGKHAGWQLTAFVYWYLIVLPRRMIQLAKARDFDVIFVQRSMFRWKSPPILEWIASRVSGKPMAYHMDDGIWLAARRRWSVDRCRIATTVVTGNAAISEFAEAAGAEVTPIEYSIDVAAYPVKRHTEDGPVVIGYTGIAPEEHLEPIAGVLREVCEESGARFRVIGGLHRPDLPELDPYLDWAPWNHNDKYSWARDFDIGVMPLSDTELHRAKDPMKVKEYMAAGLPQVTSPVGHILSVMTDGEQGLFASSDREWKEGLLRLVRDADLRAEMGAKGRAVMLERYDLPRLLEDLSAMFHRLAGVNSVPRG